MKRAVERLYEGREGWNFDQWEQRFIDSLGGVTDRGYVAALQRVLASSSKAACLVLMGGGRFQELSLESYLYHTREPATHKMHTFSLRGEKILKSYSIPCCRMNKYILGACNKIWIIHPYLIFHVSMTPFGVKTMPRCYSWLASVPSAPCPAALRPGLAII